VLDNIMDQEKKDPPEEYIDDTGTKSSEIPHKEDLVKDITEVEVDKYGVAKPKRNIIRGKIISD